jgi:hypothetical protein
VERLRQHIADDHFAQSRLRRVAKFDTVGNDVADLCALLVGDLVDLKRLQFEERDVERDAREIVDFDGRVREREAAFFGDGLLVERAHVGMVETGDGGGTNRIFQHARAIARGGDVDVINGGRGKLHRGQCETEEAALRGGVRVVVRLVRREADAARGGKRGARLRVCDERDARAVDGDCAAAATREDCAEGIDDGGGG